MRYLFILNLKYNFTCFLLPWLSCAVVTKFNFFLKESSTGYFLSDPWNTIRMSYPSWWLFCNGIREAISLFVGMYAKSMTIVERTFRYLLFNILYFHYNCVHNVFMTLYYFQSASCQKISSDVRKISQRRRLCLLSLRWREGDIEHKSIKKRNYNLSIKVDDTQKSWWW
jgi:hypothetical protein